MKRLLSIILMLAMLFSMVQFPIVVSATSSNISTYADDDDGPADMQPGNSQNRDDDDVFADDDGPADMNPSNSQNRDDDDGPADMDSGNDSNQNKDDEEVVEGKPSNNQTPSDDEEFAGSSGTSTGTQDNNSTPSDDDDFVEDNGPADMQPDYNSSEDSGPADMESSYESSSSSCNHSKTKKRYHDYTYEKYDSEKHKFTKEYDLVCKDCEKTIKSSLKVSGQELHYFKNGECEDCGYVIKNCSHEETKDRVVEWIAEGDGIYYIEYEVLCSVCDKKLSTYVKHGPVVAIPKDTNCAHEDLTEVVEKEYYETLNEKQHIKVSECKLQCTDCKKLFGDYKIEETKEHSVKNGKCTLCTYEKTSSSSNQTSKEQSTGTTTSKNQTSSINKNSGNKQNSSTSKNQISSENANQTVEPIDWIYIKANEQNFAVDGNAVSWDAMPILDPDGNLRVPLRQLAEIMGWKVEWDAEKEHAIVTDGETTKTFMKGFDVYQIKNGDGDKVYYQNLQNKVSSENGILYVDLVGALNSTGYSYYINGTSYHIKKTEEVINKVAISNILGNYNVVASEDILDTVNGVVEVTKDDYLLAMIPKRDSVFFAVIVPAAQQALQGNYYDGEVTLLGTALEIVVGVLPVVGVVADVRDLLADLQSEDDSTLHYVQTAGDIFAVVMDYKEIEKAGQLLSTLKKSGKVLDAGDVADVNKFIQNADNFEDVADYALKNLDEYNDAVQKADKVTDVAQTTTKKVSKANSRTLAKRLEEAGFKRPTEYKSAAHHIVAGNSKYAEKSRKILEEFDIDINDAANGVFLPTEKGVSKAAYHPSLNTKMYNENVYEMLKKADTREAALDTLAKIRNMLLEGTFKY